MSASAPRTGIASRLRRYGARIGLVVLMLSPSLLYLSKLPDFGRCQYNDYYGIIMVLMDGNRVTRNPVRWLKLKSNEHTVTLPALVYVANTVLTHGDNRGLSAFALFLLFLTWAVLYRLAARTLDLPPPGRWLAGFVLAAFVLSPVPAHSVVLGFSGTIWFMSNLFTVAAIGLLIREIDGRPASIVPVVLVGFLGALSYSTNLSLWPALIVAALLLRRPLRHLVVIAAVGAAVYVVFFHFFRPLPWHPKMETSHPLVLLHYTFTYLGNLFSAHIERAAILGGIGLLGCVAFASRAVVSRSRELQRRCAPWLGLQVYVLGNAIGTAVGRSGFGIGQALSSRYSSLSTLFWIAELALLVVILMCGRPAREQHRRWLPATAPLLAAAFLLALTYHHGLAVYRGYLGRAASQPLAAEAVRRGIPDWEVLRTLTPAPEQIRPVWRFLKSHGQVPFDQPEPPLPTAPISIERTDRTGSAVQGHFDKLFRVTGHTWRAWGWAYDGGSPVREVLLVDERGVAVARMVLGLPRPGVAKVVGRGALVSGWGGYVTVEDSEPFPDVAVVLGDGMAVLLHGRPEVIGEGDAR